MNLEISVVIPVYNSGASLSDLYKGLFDTLNGNFELILVDDGSTDKSREQIVTLASEHANVRPVFLLRNCGQQEATLCGLSYARTPLVVSMDADLQHPPELIPKMLSMLNNQNLDIVYAAASGSGPDGFGGKMRDFLFYLLFPKSRGLRLSSFRVMRFELCERVLNKRRGFNYFSAIVFSRPVRAASVTFDYTPRTMGKSSYNFANKAKLFMNIFIHYGPFSRLFAGKPVQAFPIEGTENHV